MNILYSLGIDAIIVQDFGLASFLIKNFPDLPIHGSTQMTINSLEGVLELEKLGFKRVVLSRELSISEIEYICKNSNIEIEVFIHGALCISYSGQCLFSSVVGGRSGNRGKCAQACRLPYKLLENNNLIDKGFLLSPKDLCGLEYIEDLIKSGVTSFKIEGRMKSPDYVAIVTKIYRKYIDKISNGKTCTIEEADKEALLQAFNRGGFSSGHLDDSPNNSLIFKEKSNNMGIYIGNVYNYNSNKGHISLNLNNTLSLGDTISFEKEDTKYTISELMIEDKNTSTATIGQKVKIGRMKGNIKPGDKIFKLSSNDLINSVKDSYTSLELIKKNLDCNIVVHENKPITISVSDGNDTVELISNLIPVKAINSPITEERIIKQLSKTNNTPFNFAHINVDLEENLHIPSISELNALRRNSLMEFENLLINKFIRNKKKISSPIETLTKSSPIDCSNFRIHKISLLLNILNLEFDYTNLKNIDKLYIPLKYFANNKYNKILSTLSNLFSIYIYMPTVIKDNYRNLFKNNIENALKKFRIKGFVVSNLGTFELLKDFRYKYEFIANYTLNVFNSITANSLNCNTVTLSPELSKKDLISLCNTISCNKELIVYGALPLMTMGYCLLGESNKCYPTCKSRCSSSNKYYLKDRLGFSFRILPDNIQTITTLYNSKITSILYNELRLNSVRIDVLDETIDEINNIIEKVKNNERFEGENYTNGNLNKVV